MSAPKTITIEQHEATVQALIAQRNAAMNACVQLEVQLQLTAQHGRALETRLAEIQAAAEKGRAADGKDTHAA